MSSPFQLPQVVKRLEAKYKDLYSIQNVAISGTHSHSGVAGFLEHLLFQVTSLGFIPEAFYAQVDGIVEVRDPRTIVHSYFSLVCQSVSGSMC